MQIFNHIFILKSVESLIYIQTSMQIFVNFTSPKSYFKS